MWRKTKSMYIGVQKDNIDNNSTTQSLQSLDTCSETEKKEKNSSKRKKRKEKQAELLTEMRINVAPMAELHSQMKLEGAVCLLSESPFKILKVAARGNFQEFERLYKADKTRLNLQDGKGFSSLHFAAQNGHLFIVDYIVSQGGDLNIQNKSGNTPLHCAVEKEQTEVINFLITNNADTTIQNENFMAPIHLAVELDLQKSLEALLNVCIEIRAGILLFTTTGRIPLLVDEITIPEGTLKSEALLQHDKVDPNLQGEKGCTALHYCASKDRDQCAKLLLERGAKPCRTCMNGSYPIHLAAKSASAKTLEVLIKHVESLGYTREDVLSFGDKENNMPLHSAVNSGDLKAVKVCLAAGAPVDVQQEDKSTPLHFACSQGNLEMVQLMHDMQPERFARAIKAEDILKMTPLHRAALFDHVSVVNYLIKQGANIDVQDTQDRSPLLLAASKGAWNTVQSLLDNKANILTRDKNNRNFFHLSIRFGGRMCTFGCDIIREIKENLLNQKDDMGCTPLHYASREGHLVAIDDLIHLGAKINPKNNEKQSPLHFAARYGRYNTCKRLLESVQGPNIINETDGDGLSALHLASLNGNTKIINLLLQKGASVTSDNDNNNPLHMAAANNYTKSMKLLLGVHGNLLDAANKQGDTALHFAARTGQTAAVKLLLTVGANFTRNKEEKQFFDYVIDNRHTDVALAIIEHERWSEALALCSTTYGCPLTGLIQHLPEVSMNVLDKCQITADCDCDSKDYYVEYNFKHLQIPLSFVRKLREEGKNPIPMFALNKMVEYGRVECLSHPVCTAYLSMKWRAYGFWFHSLNLFIYAMFLGLLTYLVTSESIASLGTCTVNCTNYTLPEHKENLYEMNTRHMLIAGVVGIFTILNFLKELLQMMQQKMKYFTDWNNALEWVLYVSTILFVAPLVAGKSNHFQWEGAAVSIFLAWFNCLLYLQRFDFFGIYVVMFLEILRTLFRALCVFSMLIIAFGLAFFILLSAEESKAYSTPGLSLLRTAMMMLELDYMASFNLPYTDSDNQTLHFGGLTMFFLVMFVLLMPILLINLLIGLAVGDIESVQKNAKLKRLAMQVEFQTDLERRMPQRLLEKVDKDTYRIYPNKCSSYLSLLWLKISVSSSTEELNSEENRQRQYLHRELYKQKTRLKEISSTMQKHYDLLRLIVQKMEIHTEDDNRDEGMQTADSLEYLHPGSNWNHDSRWQNVIVPTTVVSHWKNTVKKQYQK